jgi:hypothetical protein
MINFFDIIKGIYKKEKIDLSEINNSLLITLNKWLSYDKDNLESLKNILEYLFEIDPECYFILLYLNIPKKQNVPFLRKIFKIDKKKDELLEKIKYHFDWSDKELEYNMSILKETILKNKKYWKKEFGL